MSTQFSSSMTEMVMTSEAPVSHSFQMHAVVAFDSDDMSSVLHLASPYSLF
jgi:hypothetical protein